MSDVLFSRQSSLGLITLNRPHALNAMNTSMVAGINAALDECERDGAIRTVLVQGAGGKAFCAGGDVREAVTAQIEEAAHFFREEYRLNYRIATFPKPYLNLIDGICMGGGVGISINGRQCFVTDHALIAMPETAIGLFPDVGAGYFLARCPGAIGMWMALTGARLSAADAVYAGLATGVSPATSVLPAQQAAIDDAFSAATLEGIFERLTAQKTEWAQTQLTILRAASPTSLAVTFAHMRWSVGKTLREVLARDYELTSACLRFGDFHEGVRALLIDKDKNPRWNTVSKLDTAPIGGALFDNA